MTTPRYPQGCSDGSKECEEASLRAAWSPSVRWCVNFNNGNVNDNHDNNNARVRAVRSWSGPSSVGECQGVVNFKALYSAMRCARRNKVASANQLAFEAHWPERLFKIQEQLNAGTWSPAPTNCFVARRPKAREIHAPDFGDRVVHHWLVAHLESVYEPRFIFDSHANRSGHGTHVAVDRLRAQIRQVESGQSGGHYLQLDVHNFFNTIHRPTLWAMLKRQMQKADSPAVYQRAAHALLKQSVERQGVRHRSSASERALVPHHKRLENAAPDCGLPIGNLSSQFLANVYLDRLDQFVKHELKARRYVRYVDDFVLVHESREQLEEWKDRIEQFLARELRLSLKDDVRLRPLSAGIDFLGYVIYPTHSRVRRRVVSHAKTALALWESRHVQGDAIVATASDLRQMQSIWASYEGHFKHANAWRLTQCIRRRFAWLQSAATPRRFSAHLEGRRVQLEVCR